MKIILKVNTSSVKISHIITHLTILTQSIGYSGMLHHRSLNYQKKKIIDSPQMLNISLVQILSLYRQIIRIHNNNFAIIKWKMN